MAGVVTAMLLYKRRHTQITPEAVEIQWAMDWDTTPVALTGGRINGDRLDFNLGEHSVSLIPWREPLELDFGKLGRISRWWPVDRPFTDDYSDRYLVMLSNIGDLDIIAANILLARVLASIIKVAPENLAVFWQTAMQVVQPEEFRRLVLQEQLLPLIWLWVSIQAETTDADGVMQVHTTGLGHLGLLELEIPAWDRDEQSAFALLSNLAVHLVKNGMALEDGEMLSLDDRGGIIQAHYVRSRKNPDKQVIQLRFPQLGA